MPRRQELAQRDVAFEDVMADPARELAALAAVLGLSEKVPPSPSKHP